MVSAVITSSATPSPMAEKAIDRQEDTRDVITRAGVAINPADIEKVFSKQAHMEAQVIGIPSPILGQEPFVVIRELEAPFNSSMRLRNMVSAQLGDAYELGAVLTLGQLGLDDWPMDSPGKISKAHLRACVRGYLQRSPDPFDSKVRWGYF
ncbi:hypothetical protein FH972_021003 [Carpinus fangiana]|uniref:AMP-binding enzyme C-terminal domain-containing protein n=1 Tax=Carpinus fangiana TaxID=176857 RepID=A0A5N6KNF9_9ROSI|nr:hypothetical protein FH972_021003 [Carpinus fangiana]